MDSGEFDMDEIVGIAAKMSDKRQKTETPP